MKTLTTNSEIQAIIAARGITRELMLEGEDEDYARAMARPENQTKYHHLSEIKDLVELEEKLGDKWWRMNNLYYILDKAGQRVLFKCKIGQRRLFDDRWFRTVVLKARQYGFTTFIDLYFLDEILFNSDVEASIIAHNLDDAKKIFRRKVLYPYEQLPESIRSRRPLETKSKSELVIDHGPGKSSIISVSTSIRSGTAQYLHISEFGKICARYPEKAREIVTGAIEAIAQGQMVFIESTAEGRFGYFYDYCKIARDKEIEGKRLSPLDYKYFFSAWWEDPEYQVASEFFQPIPVELTNYFNDLETKIGQRLSIGQRSWWYQKWLILGDDMKREYPATFEEAFEFVVKGAYFGSQFMKMRHEKRICSVPYEPGVLVDTWWDLGMNDIMAIWFTQDVGREIHVIDYYQASDEGFEYYRDILADKKYRYGTHWAPHDISVRELGPGAMRWESAKKLGIYFQRVPKCSNKRDSIQAARSIFPLCWFDESNCALGLRHLENYRKEWDPHLGTYKRTPLHDEASNAADAFQGLGMGHQRHLVVKNNKAGVGVAVTQKAPPSGGWT